MNKKFQKVIATILTATMVLSVSMPAFAQNNIDTEEYLYGDYCDYTLEELAEHTAFQPFALVANPVKELLNETTEKANYLKQYDLSGEYIGMLSVLDIDNIYDTILSENLTEEQAATLIRTWATNENIGVTAEAPLEIKTPENMYNVDEDENVGNLISPMAYSGDIMVDARSYDNTGYHYIVRSVTGYNKASGHITLPTTTFGSNMPSGNPDVPCAHFGIYTSDETIGFDLGMSLHSDGYWRCCISGYAKYPGALKDNGGEEYTTYYKEMYNADGSTLKFTKSKCPKVYFVVNAIKQSGYDTFRLTTVNSTTWETMGEIIVNTNEKGYPARYNEKGELIPNLAPNKSYLNTNYSNCRLHREVTIAYNKDVSRVLTGTKVEGATWEKVYIYSPTVTALWGTTYTASANYQAKTETMAKKVYTAITNKWYEDTTRIVCQ